MRMFDERRVYHMAKQTPRAVRMRRRGGGQWLQAAGGLGSEEEVSPAGESPAGRAVERG